MSPAHAAAFRTSSRSTSRFQALFTAFLSSNPKYTTRAPRYVERTIAASRNGSPRAGFAPSV
jgi:hypothetical protein